MTMTRAEEARRLHSVAVLLENDAGFHERYKRLKGACGRRQAVRYCAVKLGGTDEAVTTSGDFIVVAGERFMSREYLRRYFDMRFEMPDAIDERDDSRARRSQQFPFEFWLDKEQWPDQKRAGEPPVSPQSQPQSQPTQEQSIMLNITTKTLINGVDIADKTNDQLFDAIAQAEAEIAKLNAIQSKPKALVVKIEELKAGIAALVSHMDAKV